MKKKIVISCGPIPAKFDAVKYITNRFKGGLALKTVKFFADKGHNVTIVKWKYSDCDLTMEHSEHLTVVNIDDVEEYYNWFRDNAKKYDVFIMAAAVANLEPVEPYNGKFQSHLYKEGEEFPISFKIAPRAIDVIKKENPRAFLVGYKLNDAASDDELIRIAKHTLQSSKANVIFANTPQDAKLRKIALLQDGSVIPMTFGYHLEFINRLIQQEYFSTTVIDADKSSVYRRNKEKIESAYHAVRMFEKSLDSFGSIAIRITGESFVTTSRGHRGEPVFVEKIDVAHGKVYATAKATLNAPAMYAVLENSYDFAFHRHDLTSGDSFIRSNYIFPGTFDEYEKVYSFFRNSSFTALSFCEPFHGSICGVKNTMSIERMHYIVYAITGIKNSIEPVDWNRYHELFPEKYFKPVRAIEDLEALCKGGETLEIGGNRYSTAKYVCDPYVTDFECSDSTEAYVSYSFVDSHLFDLIFCKNAVNYLSEEEIDIAIHALAKNGTFIANTFDGAPFFRVTENEIVFSDSGRVYHFLVVDGHVYYHWFYNRTAEWYKKKGFTVEKYGKNSLIVSYGKGESA